MKKLFTLLLALLLVLTASAETIRFDGITPSFTAIDYNSGATLAVTAEKLVILGMTDEEQVLAYANNTLFTIEPDELARISAKIDIDDLPILSELKVVDRGSSSATVEPIQRSLALLGYFNSSVDGNYGSRTANAVSAFQADRGLEETGVADAITQRLIYSLAGAETVITANVAPIDQFEAIKDRTEVSLKPLEGQGLSFEYDDVAGTGFIGNGSVVTVSNGDANIDSYVFALRFGIAVAEGKEAVTLTPAIEITNTSVRRPIMQKVILKSGDARVTIKTTGVSATVAGSKSVETGTVKLTSEALDLLSTCDGNGELKIRIMGKYENYDIDVPVTQLAIIAEMSGFASSISPEE